jgi:3-deoxy-D-manno-octulosonate 8-phosphate phosphatase (KDO 8-P phosphatase)
MQKKIDMALNQISTIFFDVDGIFTDGGLYFSENGSHHKKFNVHDGLGCILLKQVGIDIIILTARKSVAVEERFEELDIKKVFTKILKKRSFIRNYKKNYNLKKNELAIMGDDLQDIVAKEEVGIFFTTPNAVDDVKNSADYITNLFGGHGAVREICDLIIRSKGSNPALEFENYIKER